MTPARTVTTTTAPPPAKALIIRLIKTAGPAAVSLIVAWGTIQFSRGIDAHRLTELEKESADHVTRAEFQTWTAQQKETNAKIDKLFTREEFKIFEDQQREQLREIQAALRDLRKK